MRLLILALLLAATSATSITNGIATATLSGAEGLTALSTADAALTFVNDSWALTLGKLGNASPSTCAFQQASSASASTASTSSTASTASPSATLSWSCPGGVSVAAHYTLRPGAAFVTKELHIARSPSGATNSSLFRVVSVNVFDTVSVSSSTPPSGAAAGTTATPPPTTTTMAEWDVRLNPYFGANGVGQQGEIAGFGRFLDATTHQITGRGFFMSVTNPFFTLSLGQEDGNASCTRGQNLVGSDLPGMPLLGFTAAKCEAKCQSEAGCKSYVFLEEGCEGHSSGAACYLKTGTQATTKDEACSCFAAKPFASFASTSSTSPASPSYGSSSASALPPLTASYAAGIDHDSSWGEDHITEAGVVGFTVLSKHWYDGGDSGRFNIGERAAFVACTESFLLDAASRQNKTVKVNVAWDESDYQIDVGEEAGRDEYKRIIDRNAEFGSTHIVYEPRNTLWASRFNSTDGWGWEASLWFSMGERVREARWDPLVDAVPADILGMVQYAKGKGVGLLAYVYPCLAFQRYKEHVIHGALDLSPRVVQNWMRDTLLAFMTKTGAEGFAWDHDIFAGGVELRYAQWRAWMRILAALRGRFPDMVMDHRQTNHMWGPWYQLAGSYAEPIAGDENPETYGVPIASLSTDHVAADNTRRVNYKYATEQFLPPSRVPGFIFHQTERTADNGTSACFGSEKLCYDMNTRDFDLLGYQYSLLSTVGTAGQNLVLTMIPARDVAEYAMFPKEDMAFIQHWIAWTDDNLVLLRNTMPIATLGGPALGSVDGTAAMHGDEGVVFLFNPNMLTETAALTVDESVGISNSSAGRTWHVVELYPRPGASVGVWAHGQQVSVGVQGSDARVLKLTLVVKQDVTEGAQQKALQKEHQQHPALVCGMGSSAVVHAMPISPQAVAPVSFAGGWFNVSFVVTQAISDQLAARKKAYPIEWTETDARAAWLVPHRLLMAPFIADPADSMVVDMLIDGKPVAPTPAYNSRGRKISRCYLGLYFDASALTVGGQHTLALKLPALAPGRFQGVFWQNLETEWGEGEVEGCREAATAHPSSTLAADTGVSLPDYDAWDAVLATHVSAGLPTHTVDYKAVRDDANYTRFIASLETATTTGLSMNETYALFMNAYNALAMKMIIDHPCKHNIFGKCEGPIKSITDIGVKISGAASTVWLKPAGVIGGKTYSLQAIEDLLRAPTPFPEDPRLHSCIVCASQSCPNVRRTAFRPEVIDAQMGENFRSMVNNTVKGMQIDRSTGTVTLSKIFSWYAADFKKQANGSVLSFIEPFITSPDDRSYIAAHKADLTLSYFTYDWDANGPVPCNCTR